MNYKLVIGVVLSLALVLCIAISVYIYKISEFSDTKVERMTQVALDRITDECTNETHEFAMVSTQEKKVSPNAVIIKKTNYKRCGNCIKTYENVPQNIVNMRENELSKVYPEWEIESFSNNEIVLKKEDDDICNEHYEICDEEGEVVVYHIDKNNIKTVFEKTGIMLEYLPKQDIERIKKGIFVHGKDVLNKMLENLE